MSSDETVDVLPAIAAWNAAVGHSRANPGHALGPYADDDGKLQIDCNMCDFDTGRKEASDG